MISDFGPAPFPYFTYTITEEYNPPPLLPVCIIKYTSFILYEKKYHVHLYLT